MFLVWSAYLFVSSLSEESTYVRVRKVAYVRIALADSGSHIFKVLSSEHCTSLSIHLPLGLLASSCSFLPLLQNPGLWWRRALPCLCDYLANPRGLLRHCSPFPAASTCFVPLWKPASFINPQVLQDSSKREILGERNTTSVSIFFIPLSPFRIIFHCHHSRPAWDAWAHCLPF